MVIFVKPDGTTVIENDVLALGSYVGKIAIVSPSRPGAFVELMITDPSGKYVPPLYGAPMLSTDAEQLGIYICDIAQRLTVMSGRVKYQVRFVYDGEIEELTPVGTFVIQPGVITIPPEQPMGDMYEEIRSAIISCMTNYSEVIERLETVWESANIITENIKGVFEAKVDASASAGRAENYAGTALGYASTAQDSAARAASAAAAAEEAKNALAKISRLKFRIVSTLPVADIDMNTIYLERGNENNNDKFQEYVFIPTNPPDDNDTTFKLYTVDEGIWERVGSQQISLDDYATISWVTDNYPKRQEVQTIARDQVQHAADSGQFKPIKGVDYFDGKDGYTPVKGIDYRDGEDGYTPVKGIDYRDGIDGISASHRWDGTTLIMTSASGTSSSDLKGRQGDPGYSGVHVGSDTPPDSANVWIDENGEPSGVETWTFTVENEDGTTSTVKKNIVVVN